MSKPWLDWTGTEEGDSHLVTLLKVICLLTRMRLATQDKCVHESERGTRCMHSTGELHACVQLKWLPLCRMLDLSGRSVPRMTQGMAQSKKARDNFTHTRFSLSLLLLVPIRY